MNLLNISRSTVESSLSIFLLQDVQLGGIHFSSTIRFALRTSNSDGRMRKKPMCKVDSNRGPLEYLALTLTILPRLSIISFFPNPSTYICHLFTDGVVRIIFCLQLFALPP